MTRIDILLEQFRHMEWADSVVWHAVLDSGAGPGDPSLRDTLTHMHMTQRAFLLIWRGDAVELPDRDEFSDMEALRDWARIYYPLAISFLEEAPPDSFHDVVEIPWAHYFEERFGTTMEPVTLAETAHQVAAHTMHHRGQVTRRLREIEGEPPLIDYIAWIWFGRPEPIW